MSEKKSSEAWRCPHKKLYTFYNFSVLLLFSLPPQISHSYYLSISLQHELRYLLTHEDLIDHRPGWSQGIYCSMVGRGSMWYVPVKYIWIYCLLFNGFIGSFNSNLFGFISSLICKLAVNLGQITVWQWINCLFWTMNQDHCCISFCPSSI